MHVAEEKSLPQTTAGLLELLHTEPFCLLLSHLTGLDLAKDVIRLNTQGGGGGDDDDYGEPCSSSSLLSNCSNGHTLGELYTMWIVTGSGTDRTVILAKMELLTFARQKCVALTALKHPEPQIILKEILKERVLTEPLSMELLVLKTNVPGLVEEGPVAARLWLRWEANFCTGDLETTVWSATRTPPLERLSSTSSSTSAVNVSSSAEDNVRCPLSPSLPPPYDCTGWSGDCGGVRVYVARGEDEEVSLLGQLLPDSVEFSPLTAAVSVTIRECSLSGVL